jgi:hypothetical protein
MSYLTFMILGTGKKKICLLFSLSYFYDFSGLILLDEGFFYLVFFYFYHLILG